MSGAIDRLRRCVAPYAADHREDAIVVNCGDAVEALALIDDLRCENDRVAQEARDISAHDRGLMGEQITRADAAVVECARVTTERDAARAEAARLRAIVEAADDLIACDYAAEVESYSETAPGSHAAAQVRAADAYSALVRLRDAWREAQGAAATPPTVAAEAATGAALAGEGRAVSAFDEARAACVERWGSPAATYRVGDQEPYALDRWSVGAASVWLCRATSGRIAITAGLPYVTGVPMQEWVLTGPGATPLPDAIDAAVRWMAECNDPTKGP